MDFFATQDSRKNQSLIILGVFVLAMLAIAVVVHVVSVVISVPIRGSIDFVNPTLPAKLFIGLIWLTCFIGCFFRIMDVRAGGAALARRFGGVELTSSQQYKDEKILLDIVSEMAVASSCQMPRVFLLHRENSINAFVVGGFSGKEALVVSQGALRKLDRDQLTAVVAHEFGHIAQYDIPTNMRLLIALGGLNAIDEVGRLLMVRVDGKLIGHPGVIVGFVIRGIGSIGVFFGRLLRSAFSRQREFLADASAVQFLRNPEHIAAALSHIRDEHDEEAIHGVHAEEITHLCFQSGEINNWFKRVFATHPPIQKRIDAIDPHYETKKRTKKRNAEKQKPDNVYRLPASTAAQPMSFEGGLESMALSDQAMVLLVDSSSCLAALHAVFASDDKEKNRLYYQAIAFAYNKIFSHQVREIREALHSELHTNQVAIIEHATNQLKASIKLDNRQRLLQSLEKLLMVEKEFTLMNYATLQLIRRKLDADFPVLQKKHDNQDADSQGFGAAHQGAELSTTSAANAKTFDTMGREFALLLSLIVESSGSQTSKQEEQFQAALRCYTKEEFPRRSGDEPGIVKELEASFQSLYVQPRAIREAFVQHCLEIAQADGHIARNEKALLNLFAVSLNCNAIAA